MRSPLFAALPGLILLVLGFLGVMGYITVTVWVLACVALGVFAGFSSWFTPTKEKKHEP